MLREAMKGEKKKNKKRGCCYFFTVTIKIIGWLNWKTTAGRTALWIVACIH
jgi:hypothetical protein